MTILVGSPQVCVSTTNRALSVLITSPHLLESRLSLQRLPCLNLYEVA